MMKNAVELVLKEYLPIITNPRLTNESIKLPYFDEAVVMQLVEDYQNYLKHHKALIRVTTPIIIVGDIHGSIFDLIRIFQIFGAPSNRNYLFLGDYVDRGAFSIEVMTLLMALKLRFSSNMHILRGNHEFKHINKVYGFYNEIMEVFAEEACFEKFNDMFSYMPFAAVINSQVLCVHGGISPQLEGIDSIEKITLPVPQYESMPLISDLVWSDPREDSKTYTTNQRGSGTFFGTSVLKTFLTDNNLKLLVRAHQCVMDGFALFSNSMGATIFSASNYCHIVDNKCGAMVMKSSGEVEFYSIDRNSPRSIKAKTVMVLAKRGLGLQVKSGSAADNNRGYNSTIINDDNVGINSTNTKIESQTKVITAPSSFRRRSHSMSKSVNLDRPPSLVTQYVQKTQVASNSPAPASIPTPAANNAAVSPSSSTAAVNATSNAAAASLQFNAPSASQPITPNSTSMKNNRMGLNLNLNLANVNPTPSYLSRSARASLQPSMLVRSQILQMKSSSSSSSSSSDSLSDSNSFESQPSPRPSPASAAPAKTNSLYPSPRTLSKPPILLAARPRYRDNQPESTKNSDGNFSVSPGSVPIKRTLSSRSQSFASMSSLTSQANNPPPSALATPGSSKQVVINKTSYVK